MKCPVCKSEINKILLKSENRHGRFVEKPVSEFDLYKCTMCDLVGLPQVETDASYYDLYYPRGYHAQTSPKLLGRMWNFFSVFLTMRKIKLIKRYISLPCSLLDVGCGDGGFLKLLDSRLFNAHGLEPVQEAVDAATKAGLQVTRGNILKDALSPEKFNVVTLWHVFEHIKDPETALRRIHAILRPGGLLVMSMPNVNSLAFRLGGKYWFHLDSPRHLWLYNETNIKTLLAASSFKVETCRYLPFEFPLDLFWSIKHAPLGKVLLLFYPLLKWFDKQNLLIVARKK